VGIYILISRGCLAGLARHLLNKSIDIAADSLRRDPLGGTGWLSDLWGYTIAAPEVGGRVAEKSRLESCTSSWQPTESACKLPCHRRVFRWLPETCAGAH
jgi:hypothetical protein